MSRESINAICAALPGAAWSAPWGEGHDCWKIAGKVFATIGARGESVSVKTRSIDEAEMLIETGIATKAAYLHPSWIALPLNSAPEELGHRIRISYQIVRTGLPKKVQAGLPPA